MFCLKIHWQDENMKMILEGCQSLLGLNLACTHIANATIKVLARYKSLIFLSSSGCTQQWQNIWCTDCVLVDAVWCCALWIWHIAFISLIKACSIWPQGWAVADSAILTSPAAPRLVLTCKLLTYLQFFQASYHFCGQSMSCCII